MLSFPVEAFSEYAVIMFDFKIMVDQPERRHKVQTGDPM